MGVITASSCDTHVTWILGGVAHDLYLEVIYLVSTIFGLFQVQVVL